MRHFQFWDHWGRVVGYFCWGPLGSSCRILFLALWGIFNFGDHWGRLGVDFFFWAQNWFLERLFTPVGPHLNQFGGRNLSPGVDIFPLGGCFYPWGVGVTMRPLTVKTRLVTPGGGFAPPKAPQDHFVLSIIIWGGHINPARCGIFHTLFFFQLFDKFCCRGRRQGR